MINIPEIADSITKLHDACKRTPESKAQQILMGRIKRLRKWLRKTNNGIQRHKNGNMGGLSPNDAERELVRINSSLDDAYKDLNEL